MNWIRYRDCKPELGQPVIVLIDGVVHQGYLKERTLPGSFCPIVFQMIMVPGRVDTVPKAWHWGYDPYWLPISGLPIQESAPILEPRELLEYMANAEARSLDSRHEVQEILDTHEPDSEIHDFAQLIMWEFEYFDEHGTYDYVEEQNAEPASDK
jgi:hypothetical protein